MGRWVIVGFVVLAGAVFWLTRPPTEAPERATQETPAPVAEAEPKDDATAEAAQKTAAGDDGKRYEFAKIEDERAPAERAGWRGGHRDGFDAPRLSPEAIEMLENPKAEPIPEENLPKRYQYDPHIEGLIEGTAESKHKGAVDDFMAENPPGRYQWTELQFGAPGVPPPSTAPNAAPEESAGSEQP